MHTPTTVELYLDLLGVPISNLKKQLNKCYSQQKLSTTPSGLCMHDCTQV